MSLSDWSHKPWMRPPMYTSDVDPTLQQHAAKSNVRELSHEDVESLISGESDRMGHMPLPDLGDGRPNPAMADNTPIDYNRGPSRGDRNMIDLDDREEADLSPVQTYEDYLPKPKEESPRPMPQLSKPKPPTLIDELARFSASKPTVDTLLNVKLLGIIPQTAHINATIDLWISGMTLRVTPDDLEHAAMEFAAWAKAARAIKL